KNRKYALLLFFVFAAILTPPDVVTQVMMAGPLMILYEISIIGAVIFGKKS
ncbi:MAG: twin-arginine translocase subunit TatC, partial [bacterium]|nr:twin-arginine translocase subunit TatC [bacterium]